MKMQPIFDTIGVLAFILVCFSFVLPYFEDKSPPITIISAQFEEESIQVGGTAHLVIKGIRNRICPASVLSFWVSENGTRIQNPIVSASPIQELGPYTVRLAKTLPPSVTPGIWFYEAQVSPNCDVDEPAVIQDPVAITVTP